MWVLWVAPRDLKRTLPIYRCHYESLNFGTDCTLEEPEWCPHKLALALNPSPEKVQGGNRTERWGNKTVSEPQTLQVPVPLAREKIAAGNWQFYNDIVQCYTSACA